MAVNQPVANQARAIVPVARAPVSVRPATMDDVSFIDRLQKMHSKQVGWMPTAQLEGKIKAGHVIIADDAAKQSVGYCIGNDQYFKRDDVGIIYQMNVEPGKQRGLIGATLVKAMFDRAAYGCRLFCCWCAQDIEANYFWESLGFIPLAFRAGSRGKGRVHIFWQRRIREGDTTTPFWFPSQTAGGAIREDRLVLPIPPGTRWTDVMPVVLPKEKRMLEGESKGKQATAPVPLPPTRRYAQFGPPPTDLTVQAETAVVVARATKTRKPKLKNDPKHVAAARELRDKYLEQFNSGQVVLPAGKYDVSRGIESAGSAVQRQLPQAA